MLSFGAQLQHAYVPYQLSASNLVNFELRTCTPADTEHPNTTSRPPINVVCVADTSFSMDSDNKLDLVKQSLHSIVAGLVSGHDRFGLVCFGSEIFTVVDMAVVPEDRAEIARKIDQMEATGATALCGGLVKGLEMLQAVTQENACNAVMMFTDGVANIGVTRVSKVIEAITAALPARMGARPTLHTFGFGADTQTDMLVMIAEQCKGKYWYVKDNSDIPRALKMCFAQIRATRFNDIRLVVDMLGDATISAERTNALGGAFKLDAAVTKHLEIEIGRMAENQSRNLLVSVNVPPLAQSTPQLALLRATVSYHDMFSGQIVDLPTQEIGVAREQAPIAAASVAAVAASGVVSDDDAAVAQQQQQQQNAEHIHVANQINRLRTSQALGRAAVFTQKKNMDEAARVLSEAITEIRSSLAKDQECTAIFLDDLHAALSYLQPPAADGPAGETSGIDSAAGSPNTSMVSDAASTVSQPRLGEADIYSIVTDMALAHRDEVASVMCPVYATEAEDLFVGPDEDGFTSRPSFAAVQLAPVHGRTYRMRGPAVPQTRSSKELDDKLERVHEEQYGAMVADAASLARDRSAALGAAQAEQHISEELRARLNERVLHLVDDPNASMHVVVESESGAAGESEKALDENADDELRNKLKRVRSVTLEKQAGEIDAEQARGRQSKKSRESTDGAKKYEDSCGHCACTQFRANPFKARFCQCQHTHPEISCDASFSAGKDVLQPSVAQNMVN